MTKDAQPTGHTVIALIIQAIIMLAGFNAWTGAAAATWYFIGREYAQAEYRLIEQYYEGKRSNLPSFAPLKDKRAWNKKSLTDFIYPMLVVYSVALAAKYCSLFN